MKWYLHKHHNQHLKELKVQREDSMSIYYSWVIQIANTFSRDSVAIGTLNLQDLIQAGYVGLVDAHSSVDHSRGQAEKWSYIKKRIKWSIRREIENHGSFIKTPRRDIDKANAKLSNVEKIFVNIFPKFFDSEIIYQYDTRPYQIEQLSELIDDYLYIKFKTIDHVDILKYSFGIDTLLDKPLSFKELSKRYKKPEGTLRKIKQRMLESLKKDEDFKIIIENFYKN